MRYLSGYTLLALLICLNVNLAMSQEQLADTITKKLDAYRLLHPHEKLYVHLDRTFHLTGETLWFKIYCTDGTLHQPMDISKIAYVEITDKNSTSVLQAKINMSNGMGNGSFFLPASLSSGNYTFRAYTRWMRNNNPEFFFHKAITIVNPFRPLDDKVSAQAPAYQVNFFPEGGKLITGIRTKVAFSVKDSNGKGVDCKVAIVNQTNDTLTSSRTAKFGLGYFFYTPAGNSNRAVITDYHGKVSIHQLPEAVPEGFNIQVSEDINEIHVAARSISSTNRSRWICLFVHSRQIVTHAEARKIDNDSTVFTIAKNELADGISHITLFDESLKPVAERLFFKYPEKRLDVNIQTTNSEYAPRSKVTLNVLATSQNKSQKAQLSVAVYKVDSLNTAQQEGIFDYLWLSSDLTGNIESPGYYFSNAPDARTSMDLVMLTHGWRRFRWYDVIDGRNPLIRFVPEYLGHIVTGKVKDGNGAPTADAKAYLSFPDKVVRTYADISDNSGYVKFELSDFVGPHQLIVQTSHYRTPVQISIDNPFVENHIPYKTPPVTFERKMKSALDERSLFMQMQDIYYEELRTMFTVPRVDSSSFYGKAQQTYYLDDYTRFPVMEEVLKEYVPGVRVRKHDDKFNFVIVDNATGNILHGEPLVLLDGIPISTDKIMSFDPRKVRRLEVVTKQFFLGPVIQNGIVSFTTYNGDLAGFELDPKVLAIDYEGLQLQREFYLPDYSTQSEHDRKTPDFRDLLAWFPNVETDESGQVNLNFYTSDLKGDYIVVIEGISKNGFVGTGFSNFKVAGNH